ncbi:MAG: hypothetical protein RJB38_1072 [Pseudomonadota bacterium]
MRFQFQVREAPVSSTTLSSEIIIAPLSALTHSLSRLSNQAHQLSPAVEAQWREKQKALSAQAKPRASQALKTAPKKPQVAHLSLDDGSSIHLLLIPSEVSTFALQTELRKALQDFFSACSKTPPSRPILISPRELDAIEEERCLQSLAALAEMAPWEPTKYGESGKKQLESRKKASQRVRITVISNLLKAKADQALFVGQTLGLTNNEVRTLAEMPANELNPRAFEGHARDFARTHRLSYEFWNLEKLKKAKAGAFLAVNRADPRSHAGIAVLKYRPKNSKGTKHKPPILALVGKGLCFDTGGYNVKTGGHMLGMHGDMTGAALALALCGFFAKIQAPFEVHAYLALAENLISPTAYKPNEVVVACDGTSIEVIDTDAEGRMVLSDTLALVRRTQPTLCIDFATLTGAAIRSLDTRRGAVFSNRDTLAQRALEAGHRSGERTWSFPIGEDYADALESRVADLQQCASGNNADHIYAATFLSHFIGAETPWLHLDLAPAENTGGLGLANTATTGFGVFFTHAFAIDALEALKENQRKGSRS